MEGYAHHAVSWLFANLVAMVIGAYLESRLGWIEAIVGWVKGKIEEHV